MTRTHRGQFQKGVSGNPGGRPKVVAELRDLARQHTRDALDTLIAVMTDPKAPAAARVAAAQSILDRGYGKPTQHVEASVNILDRMTEDEQRALAAALEALDADEPAPGTKH